MRGEFIGVGSEAWREIWQPPIDPDWTSTARDPSSYNSPNN
jgi:hypothetical protein